MNNTVLITVNLAQFKDHKTCTWVKGLVSLSSLFFDKKSLAVNGDVLLLQSIESKFNHALNLFTILITFSF